MERKSEPAGAVTGTMYVRMYLRKVLRVLGPTTDRKCGEDVERSERNNVAEFEVVVLCLSLSPVRALID
jgi:hypothetical protein